MSNVLLTVAVCLTQLILGFMGVQVSLKPPQPKNHKYWIAAFIIVGFTGIFLTAWLSKRSDDSQTKANADIHDAQTAATNANNAATAAQQETAQARKEAREANDNLQTLINKRSTETNKTIINWRSDTESAVSKILRAPRTLGDKRSLLVSELRNAGPHNVAITAARGNEDALTFAGEIELAFKEAGWSVVQTQALVFVMRDATGLSILLKGAKGASADELMKTIKPEQLAVAKAFYDVGWRLNGSGEPGLTDTGPVEVYIGLP